MSTPPDYTIRPATAADSAAIIEMVRSEPLDPGAVDWQQFLVLEVVEAGAPTIAAIAMVRLAGDIDELDSVTTRPRFRGRGYASALVRAWLDRVSRPLYLLAETDLIAFYERLGFRLMGDDAPAAMREQAAWVNRWFGGQTTYHVMGT